MKKGIIQKLVSYYQFVAPDGYIVKYLEDKGNFEEDITLESENEKIFLYEAISRFKLKDIEHLVKEIELE